MNRYIIEFVLTQPGEPLVDAINRKLSDEGYKYIEYEYEGVYKKGNNIVTMPRFLKIVVSENKIRLEAWRKTGISVGVFYDEKSPDNSFLKTINQIEQMLLQGGASRANIPPESYADSRKEYPQVKPNLTKAEFVKKYLSRSISKEFVAAAIVFYIFSVITIILGFLAESPSPLLFVLFAFVLLIAVAMHITKNTVVSVIAAVVGLFSSILYFFAIFMSMYSVPALYHENGLSYVIPILFIVLFMAMIFSVWMLSSISLIITISKVNKYYHLVTIASKENRPRS